MSSGAQDCLPGPAGSQPTYNFNAILDAVSQRGWTVHRDVLYSGDKAAENLQASHTHLVLTTQDHPFADTTLLPAYSFCMNEGFVPGPSGLLRGPKAVALLGVDRKTRGSVNVTPPHLSPQTCLGLI